MERTKANEGSDRGTSGGAETADHRYLSFLHERVYFQAAWRAPGRRPPALPSAGKALHAELRALTVIQDPTVGVAHPTPFPPRVQDGLRGA